MDWKYYYYNFPVRINGKKTNNSECWVGETLVELVGQCLAQSERAWSSQDHFYRQRFLISESHRFMMRRCAFSSSSLSLCLGLYTSPAQRLPVKTSRKYEKYFVRLSLPGLANNQSAQWDPTANWPPTGRYQQRLLSLPRLSWVSSREYFVNKTKKTVGQSELGCLDRLQIRFL